MERVIEKSETNEWLKVCYEASLKKGKNAKLFAYVCKLAGKQKRQRVAVNLAKLEKLANEGENIIVPGKVLATGKVSKSFSISAIEFSKDAVAKLGSAKCKILKLDDIVSKENIKIVI